MFAKLNSRGQLTEDSFHRYQKMLKKRFDRVLVIRLGAAFLKGRPARLRQPQETAVLRGIPVGIRKANTTSTGCSLNGPCKCSVPADGSRWSPRTRFSTSLGLPGLRRLLATKANLRFLVDLGPFGQLFFHAMNTPCVTVADAAVKAGPDNLPLPRFRFHRRIGGLDEARVGRRQPPRFARRSSRSDRQASSIGRVRQRDPSAATNAGGDRQAGWNLAAYPRAASKKEALTAADVFDPRQGVTPGGCLDLFLIRRRSGQAGPGSGPGASCDQESRGRTLVGFVGPRVAISVSRSVGERCRPSR